jgi:large subunit ribosomal protein L10
MPNSQNKEEVKVLTDKIKDATAIYFAEYHGLNVEDITSLRSLFFEKNIEFRVSKNTLLKIACKNNNYNEIDEFLTGSTAVAFAYDDPSLPAKVFKDFTKERDLPSVKGIIFDGNILDGKQFDKIANLPSREELLSKFVMLLGSPMLNFALTVKSPMHDFVNILNQLKDKKD